MTRLPAFTCKIAETDAEVTSALRLRHRVFVEEMGADAGNQHGEERDPFDQYCDHILLIDPSQPEETSVVGTYRLLPWTREKEAGGFYTMSEFDISKLRETGAPLVELGRACIAHDYRNGVALHMLWQGVAEYVVDIGAKFLFGTASFQGRDIESLRPALSFMHDAHLAPEDLQPVAIGASAISADHYAGVDYDRRAVIKSLPPLLKSYLKLGAKVGSGAFVDVGFNTTDMCIILDADQVSAAQKSRLGAGV